MRVAVYARVSTDEQAEQGYSIETQLEICSKYAIENFRVSDKDIIKIVDDYTGTTLDRPGMNRLLALIAERKIDAVVCFSPDRLSRNLKDGLVLRETLIANGVSLHYTTVGEVRMNPSGIMMDNIYRVMSEYESELIRERTMRGRRRKMEYGYVVGHSVSYGYRLSEDKKSLVINEDEAKNIRIIFQKYADGCSVTKIADYLNSLGEEYRYKGNEWTRMTVKYFLKKADLYNGTLYQNAYVLVNKRMVKRDRSEWMEARIPKIIDDDTYARVRNRYLLGFRSSKNNGHREYLLTSLIHCLCGRRVYTYLKTKHGKKSRKYRCSCYDISQKPCNYAAVFDADFLDNLVWLYVRNLITNPDLIINAIDTALKEKVEKYNEATEKIIEIDKKIEKLVNSYISDAIPRNVFDSLLNELRAEREKYYSITKRIGYERDKNINLSRLISALDNADFQKKRAVLTELGLQVTIGKTEGGRLIVIETAIGKAKATIPNLFASARKQVVLEETLRVLNSSPIQ